MNNDQTIEALEKKIEQLEARVYELDYELKSNHIAEQQLRIKDAAIESAMTGIVLANEDELIAYANAAFLKLWGYEDVSEVLGKNPSDILWSERQKQEGGYSLDDACNQSCELEGKRTDGSCFDVLMKVILVKDADGTPLCYQAAFEDVSRRNQIEAALVKAKNSAESANRTKSAFLANMSHELRTPMNGIIGFLSLLKDEELTEKQRDYVTIIRKSADALLTVINSILEFSKLETGNIDVIEKPFSLKECIDRNVASLKEQAQEKGLAFNVEISPSVPEELMGDSQILGQILTHLLSNAVKFTNEGSVGLMVNAANLSYEYSQVVFNVKDTGIGIDKAYRQLILQPFKQADPSSTRRYGGTGLGLTISQNLCEKLGGKLSFHSVPEEGSTFTFTVLMKKRPISKQDMLCVSEKGEEESDPQKSGAYAHKELAILVVEDDVTNQLVIQMLLQSLGYSCQIVSNGLQAIEAIEKQEYDLVLMDIQMPVMDGLTAVRRLIAKGIQDRAGYIAALTAHALPQDKQACIDAGMNEVLVKPVEPERLQMLLDKLVCVENMAGA